MITVRSLFFVHIYTFGSAEQKNDAFRTGRARHTIRGRAVDEVLDMKREEDEEFNPNKHADQEGLCKFVQNLDNLVDSRMCLSHLNPASGADELNTDTVSDIPRIDVPAFTKSLVEAAKSKDPPLPSTLQERIDSIYYMDLMKKKDQEVTT